MSVSPRIDHLAAGDPQIDTMIAAGWIPFSTDGEGTAPHIWLFLPPAVIVGSPSS